MSEGTAPTGGDTVWDPSDLVKVTLLEVPVPLWERSDDEGKDLMREFALIVLNRDREVADVPSQLMELIEELERDYGNLGREQTARFGRARAEEEAVIDQIDYLLPRGTTDAVRRLAEALDAADEYCREGEHLLSLASSPGAKAFRDWVFSEFVVQLEGGEPTPWPLSSFAVAAREGVTE